MIVVGLSDKWDIAAPLTLEVVHMRIVFVDENDAKRQYSFDVTEKELNNEELLQSKIEGIYNMLMEKHGSSYTHFIDQDD